LIYSFCNKIANWAQFFYTEIKFITKSNFKELLLSLLSAFGVLFLIIESYEVLTDKNITFSVFEFIGLMLIPGIIWFLTNGFIFSGFLKHKISIEISGSNSIIEVRFGDIFLEHGWKAIAVNDFFDHIVDDDIVSSNSLHGITINRYWNGRESEWLKQVKVSLSSYTSTAIERDSGNLNRYSIGTTARVTNNHNKFLFFVLGKTNPVNNITNSDYSSLIISVRGMLKEARAACSMEQLNLPLIGSGLSRIGLSNYSLVDLIILSIIEESKNGKITEKINILLPISIRKEINLVYLKDMWDLKQESD